MNSPLPEKPPFRASIKFDAIYMQVNATKPFHEMLKINYKIKTATKEKIFLHLTECNDSFIPPLTSRVNIDQYAQKIFEKSITFEAWRDQLLIGLIAGYFNIDGSIFITNVSVFNKFAHHGIASNLLNMCIKDAQKNNFQEITLEVHKHNNIAIGLYQKFGFLVYKTENATLIMKRQI